MPQEIIYSIGEDKLTAIADAIRDQTDDDRTMTTDDMVTKINAMLSVIEPYLDNGDGEEIDSTKVYLQLVEEAEDPESGFRPDNRPFLQLMYEDSNGDYLLEPNAGVFARQGGEDKRIMSEDISVLLRMENADDERDVHLFAGHYTGGAYAFQDWDEPSDQYEISFDTWPEEDITYNCTLSATYQGNGFELKNNSVSVEFEYVLTPSPFEEEQEEDPEL